MLGTHYDVDITKDLEFTFKYDIKVAQEKAGGYSHHIITSVTNDITKRVELDVSFLWDRTSNPTTAADGTTPVPDDYKLMLGFIYAFD
jgi:hypothetical protein